MSKLQVNSMNERRYVGIEKRWFIFRLKNGGDRLVHASTRNVKWDYIHGGCDEGKWDMGARRRRRTCDHFFGLLFWVAKGHIPVLRRGV